jgi:hypothetical protein
MVGLAIFAFVFGFRGSRSTFLLPYQKIRFFVFSFTVFCIWVGFPLFLLDAKKFFHCIDGQRARSRQSLFSSDSSSDHDAA